MRHRLAEAILITLLALARGPVGPPPARAQAAPAPGPGQRSSLPEPPVVVDADGREIGPVIGVFLGLPVVRLRVGGHDVDITVSGDRLLASSDPLAEYESLNCTGPPLIREPVPGRATHIVEALPVGAVNELLAPSGSPVTRTLNSYWNSFTFPSPPTCVPLASSETAVVRETTVLVSLDLFVPPFRLR